MSPSRQVPNSTSDFTPSGEGQRGMADIFQPAQEPVSELARYRLLAPKCGRKSPIQLQWLVGVTSVLMVSTSITPLHWSNVGWRSVEGVHGEWNEL